ncbi:MAG TPA: TolC family outer membrane protein [Magnetospirillaceae bacterium]
MGYFLKPKRGVAMGAVAFVTASIVASQCWAADLEAEIQTLVASHPQIQAAKEGVDAAQAGIRAARSAYYPQVHLSANAGPEHWDNAQLVQSFGSPITRDGYGSGLTVTQHIFDGNATDAAVDSAKDTKGVSDATLTTTRQTAILEGVNAFLDVLRQSQLLKLAREDEGRLQNQLHLEDERVDRGSGVAVDVLAAKHRLQLAKERRVNYEGGLEQAIDRYSQVFGHAPDDMMQTAPEPPAALVPTTVDEAQKIAQEENPAIEAAKRSIDVSTAAIDSARSSYFPSVDLVSKADFGDNRDGNLNVSRDWEVLLELNWDLFTGFRTQAQVSQAAHTMAASKDTRDQAERKTSEAVRLAWSQVQIARERVEILDSAVNLAYNVWDSRKKMREQGKATVIDVLDSESDITNAQITYLTATFDRKIATYALLFAMGRLEPGSLAAPAGSSSSPAPTAK